MLALLLAGCGGGGALSSLPGGNSGTRSPQYQAPTTPVLYVASQDRVNAFAITARGTTPPDRTIFVHSNQTDRNASITAFIDGTLDVLQTYYPASGPSPKCRIVVESATANGTAAALNPNWDCSANAANSGVAYGIATNYSLSGIDIVYDDNGSPNYTLERFSQGFGNGILGAPGDVLTLPGAQPNLTVPIGGGPDWVNDGATTLRRYPAASTDTSCGGTCSPTALVTTATKGGTPTTFLGAMAAEFKTNTLYVIASTGSGPMHLLGYSLPTIGACNGCGTVNAQWDKTFATGTNVTAVAAGSDGTVYVGLTNASGAHVKVFTSRPDDSSNATAIGNLEALPGDGATQITSMYVYQP